MKTMKQGIALLLSVLLCVGMLSVGVWADTTISDAGVITFDSEIEATEAHYVEAGAVAKIGDVYYDTLAHAVTAANAGATVTLLSNIEIDKRQSIDKTLIIDGQGKYYIKVINKGDDRVLDISNTVNVTLTLKDVTIDGSGCKNSYDRGVSMYGNTNVKLVLDGATVTSLYYAINVAGANNGVNVEATNSSVAAGWSAFNVWSPATITVSGGELSGNNDKGYNNDGWNNFGTIVMNEGSAGSKLDIEDATITAKMNGNLQLLLDIRDDNIEMSFKNVTFKSVGTTAEDARYKFNMIGLYDKQKTDSSYAVSNEKLIFDGCSFYKGENKIEEIGDLFEYVRIYDYGTLLSTFVFDGVQLFFDNSYSGHYADYETIRVNEERKFVGGIFYDNPIGNVADEYIVTEVDGTYFVGEKATVTYTGTGVDSSTNTYEVAVGAPTPAYSGTPSYAGFIFAGWSPAVADTVTEDVTYTAQWIYYNPAPANTEIEDEDVPLADIEDEAVPLGELPEGFENDIVIEIDGEEVPLAEAPVAFEDVAEEGWEHDAVAYVSNLGLMVGIGDETFAPSATTSGKELATILYRYDDDTGLTADETWAGGVAWAADITEGIGFEADKAVTREQMVTMLYRLAQKNNRDVSETTDLSAFTDAGTLSDFAAEAMAWAVAKNIIKGYGNDLIAPQAEITRAQIATIIMRFNELTK